MKTPMIYFYRDVVGRSGGATATAAAAMHRWGVPVLEGNGANRVFRYVDATDETLAKARALYAKEAEKRVAARGKGHPTKAKERAVTDSEVIAMLTKLDDAVGLLQREVTLLATAVSVESVDGAVLRTEAKLDSLIHHLQTQAQQPTKRKS